MMRTRQQHCIETLMSQFLHGSEASAQDERRTVDEEETEPEPEPEPNAASATRSGSSANGGISTKQSTSHPSLVRFALLHDSPPPGLHTEASPLCRIRPRYTCHRMLGLRSSIPIQLCLSNSNSYPGLKQRLRSSVSLCFEDSCLGAPTASLSMRPRCACLPVDPPPNWLCLS